MPEQMPDQTLRFEFASDVTSSELEDLVAVARAALEGVCGSAEVVIEAPFRIDPGEGVVEIDPSSEVGRLGARILASLAERTVGRDGFRVRRATDSRQLAP